MRLANRFYRLPLRFDAAALAAELSDIDDDEWIRHPNDFPGNAALILVSVRGEDNHDTHGAMTPTARLSRLPYIQQIMATLPTVVGRARIMRLAPGATVTRHTDVSFYWRHRIRLHLPIVTDAGVRFFCEDQSVHMAAGELWTFDNWRYHHVCNDSDVTRTHLVIDTVGSPDLWAMLEKQAWCPDKGGVDRADHPAGSLVAPDPGFSKPIVYERFNVSGVLPPSDVDMIADEFMADLDPEPLSAIQQGQVREILRQLKRGWRTLWSVHGDTEAAKPVFRRYLDDVCKTLAQIRPAPALRSNETIIAAGLDVQLGDTLIRATTRSVKPGRSVSSQI